MPECRMKPFAMRLHLTTILYGLSPHTEKADQGPWDFRGSQKDLGPLICWVFLLLMFCFIVFVSPAKAMLQY